MSTDPDPQLRLAREQRMLLGLFAVGYAGYYLCRSNFSVCLPLLIEELGSQGLARDVARIRLGDIATLGVFAYAIGKFTNGPLTDFVGGRRAFLSGMGLSVCCTLLFAWAGGLPLFSLAWIGNRLVQSMGWPGMVRVTARWFPWSRYASAMAVVSLSFLFGDAAARWGMGLLIGAGFGWRGVFVSGAVVLTGLLVLTAWRLREAPGDRGLPEPDPHPENLFASAAELAGTEATPTGGFMEHLRPFLSSRSFWLVCGLSLGLTLLRETFNTWTPTYFVEALHLPNDAAAKASAVFPVLGGVSVLLSGWVGDRMGARGRAWIIVGGVSLTVAPLLGLGLLAEELSAVVGVLLVAAIGFLMIGPYSYLAGAISLDLGGKRGSATACGVIDGVGYMGGLLAGGGIARIVESAGWSGAFASLSAVAVLTAGVGVLFLRTVPRRSTGDAAA